MKTNYFKWIIVSLSLFTLLFFPKMLKAERNEFFKPSGVDSLPISISISTPPQGVEIKAVVQLVHGMCDHKERYYPFIDFLNQNGYVCVIHDHRGHGASVLSSQDLGFFYQAGYEGMIEDVKMVGDIMREQYPGVPFFLLGHSMGSMVVRSFTKQYDDFINGLIVCGSPSYNSGAAIGKKLAAKYARKYGDHYRPEVLQKMSFGSFNKKFKGETSPNAWVCSDTEVVKRYDADTLCNFIFTANGFENLYALMLETYDTKHWKMENKKLPVFFISGADDPCIGSTKKFLKATETMKKVGYNDVTYQLYPGMRHEILNEIGKEKVWNDILKTLNEWVANQKKVKVSIM